ncbi:MAG TPA: methylenetetrahydrofolate reductase [NAD(P)H] [Chloroflexi bacterium]|jgi:methylenetetrahydrofolate reductase (NADPH)|nr:methylenetetrahydrofolate reductase [NAD(P)H] [Anaerolineaceae bacterium]HHX07979.1 methylenetetrahydrofolate reductase [NAD(P)H] [Chloroflexota bacterium]
MNIEELLTHKKVLFSLEIFPPKKDTPYNVIYNTLLKLRGIPADFISVTYGAGGSRAQQDKTIEIASLILRTYHTEPVAHLTCVNADRDQVLETLKQLKANKVENIMVLRGDISPDYTPKEDFKHASDLAAFIKQHEPGFNLLGACYPEKHYQAQSMEEDIENLKIKIDNGVTHLITQLFFDNEKFYAFRDKAEKAGINVPIEAGIMPITNVRQIERTVALSGASVPPKLSRIFERYAKEPKAIFDAGIHYAIEQSMDLIANDIRGIHLYTMNNVDIATRVSDAIQHVLEAENNPSPN